MAVLIVEDDPALARLLRTLMVRERLGVRVESRGDTALPAIESGRYTAIVLDLMMPGMSGFEIVRHIARVRPELLRRMIVMTAASQSRLQDFEHRAAIWSLIRKPFDLPEFLRTLRECVVAHTPHRFEQIEELKRCLAAGASACGARTALAATSFDRDLMPAATFGYDNGVVEEYFPLPVSSKYPICVTVRTGRAVWLASLASRPSDYSQLLPIWTMNAAHALATVPLLAGESLLGAIGCTFGDPQQFDEAQREMVLNMANDCSTMLAKHRAAART